METFQVGAGLDISLFPQHVRLCNNTHTHTLILFPDSYEREAASRRDMQTVDCPAVTSQLGPPHPADVRRADRLAQCRETARPQGHSGKRPASSRVLPVNQHAAILSRTAYYSAEDFHYSELFLILFMVGLFSVIAIQSIHHISIAVISLIDYSVTVYCSLSMLELYTEFKRNQVLDQKGGNLVVVVFWIFKE